jgi:hypothetical protein
VATSQQPVWYRPDVSLVVRMVLTMFLLSAVYVVFAVILRYVLGLSWLVLAIVALVIVGVQFFYADKLALLSTHPFLEQRLEQMRRMQRQTVLAIPHKGRSE